VFSISAGRDVDSCIAKGLSQSIYETETLMVCIILHQIAFEPKNSILDYSSEVKSRTTGQPLLSREHSDFCPAPANLDSSLPVKLVLFLNISKHQLHKRSNRHCLLTYRYRSLGPAMCRCKRDGFSSIALLIPPLRCLFTIKAQICKSALRNQSFKSHEHIKSTQSKRQCLSRSNSPILSPLACHYRYRPH
jgi:hypothetical protein